jgi:hypothetical protein
MTMSQLNKDARPKTTQDKIVEFRQQSMIMLQPLVRSQEGADIDMEDLMTYPLTPVHTVWPLQIVS